MIKTFSEAQKFIYGHIDANPKKRFAGEFGLRRGAYLLKLIGDPQNKLKVIHVAGTSGKGSTAFYMSQLLRSQGMKVSLTISPHLVDLRERCQINNQLVSKDKFIKTLNGIIPAINKMKKTEFEKPSYFEILIAIFFKLSLDENVDYAIAETGLGGLYDGTNTVNRRDKVCIITKIGMDHIEILGDTIGKIAKHKAGIITNNNFVLTCSQDPIAMTEISKKVDEKNGVLEKVLEGHNVCNVRQIDSGLSFDFRFRGFEMKDLHLNSQAVYQSVNSSLALAALVYVAERDSFNLKKENIRKCLKSVNFPGRMETFKIKGKTIIIDGAHNPQKMTAFSESLKMIADEKWTFLVAFRAGKDFKKMLNILAPMSIKIIATSFRMSTMDMAHSSEDSENVKKYLQKIGFLNVEIVNDSYEALLQLLKQKNDHTAITGSLYLLSDLYPKIKNLSR